ncbi:MAG TPA: DUF6220 domain-containing protein [Gaiellaceae bacterium]|nr:DUF6220 domain-containing protein [Gaiellaceae bacterium]
MAQARIFLFGAAVLYLVGVVVQFFLAGLGTFGATDFGPHRGLGLALGLLSLVVAVLAVVGKVPRFLLALAVVLLGLNVLQLGLARVDVDEIAALHAVNALVVVGVAYEVVQRSRRYLTSKLAD